ncbi:hypothetical protein XENTR_v10007892 [Xenopus tropicalis]|nr:hypothetical protein XENTR_v10007892 [Xenopus tropicalis]
MIMFGIGSTLVPKKGFWVFMCLRSLLDSVKVDYMAATPALIADIFDGESRLKMQTLHYVLNTFG